MSLLKRKRGAEHIEIVISFILFIIILGFLVYYMVPLRQKNVPDVLTTIVKQGLDNNATTELNEIRLVANSKNAKIKVGASSSELYPFMYWDEASDDWKLEKPEEESISLLYRYATLFCGDKFQHCIITNNIIDCNYFSCSIGLNSIDCNGLKEWCDYRCTKIDKHSIINLDDFKKLTIKDERNQNLKWGADSEFIYIEKPDFPEDIKYYDLYYFSDPLRMEEDYLSFSECITPDNSSYSIPKKIKVYSKFRFDEIKKLTSEELKKLFDYPIGKDFAVTLLISNETVTLQTEIIPEKTTVRAQEFPVTIIQETNFNGQRILDKTIAYINIKTW